VIATIAIALIPYKTFRYGIPVDISKYGWINVLTRGDTAQYLSIAQTGYRYVPGDQTNIAFFPLYPVLIRAGGGITGLMSLEWVAVIGIIISNLSLVTALALLIALIRIDFNDTIAKRAAWYYLIFPTTIFLSSVYAESLCLMLTVGAVYCAYKKRWWGACLLGALATLARPNGFFVEIPLVVLYMMDTKFSVRKIHWNALGFLLIPLTLGGYFYYLKIKFGDYFAFLHALTFYNQKLMLPFQTFQNVFSAPLGMHTYQHSILELSSVTLMGICVLIACRYLRAPLLTYTIILYVGLLSTGTLDSNMRYWLPLFPLFIVLSILGGKYPWFDRIFTFAAIALSSLFTVMLALLYPVA
jgi:hypothetical protein